MSSLPGMHWLRRGDLLDRTFAAGIIRKGSTAFLRLSEACFF